jgi:hypothetical protein
VRKRLPHSPSKIFPFVCPEPVLNKSSFLEEEDGKEDTSIFKRCRISQVTVVSPSAVEAAAAAGIGGVLENIPIGGDCVHLSSVFLTFAPSL